MANTMVVKSDCAIRGRGVVVITKMIAGVDTGVRVRCGERTWVVRGIEAFAIPCGRDPGHPVGLLLEGLALGELRDGDVLTIDGATSP